MKIFIDTNIILDVLTKRAPYYIFSAKIWTLIKEKILQGYISAITINNFYYIIKKIRNQNIAGELIDEILEDFEIISLTKEILKQSRTIINKDYEDSIQYFSAISANCQFLVTRNKKDFISIGIQILSPLELLKTLKYKIQ